MSREHARAQLPVSMGSAGWGSVGWLGVGQADGYFGIRHAPFRRANRVAAVTARGALSGRCEGIAKTGDGHAETLGALPTTLIPLWHGHGTKWHDSRFREARSERAHPLWAGLSLERVMGIEPAFSAWKIDSGSFVTCPVLGKASSAVLSGSTSVAL